MAVGIGTACIFIAETMGAIAAMAHLPNPVISLIKAIFFCMFTPLLFHILSQTLIKKNLFPLISFYVMIFLINKGVTNHDIKRRFIRGKNL